MCLGRVDLVECGRLLGSCRLSLIPFRDPAAIQQGTQEQGGAAGKEEVQAAAGPEGGVTGSWRRGSSIEKKVKVMKRRPLVSSQGLGCSEGSGLQLFWLQGKSAFLLQRGQWERGGRAEARPGQGGTESSGLAMSK